MARDWWEDLSDDELYARLVQHGAHPGAASNAAVDRDEEDTRAAIREVLGG